MADDNKRQISVHLEEALIEQLEAAAKREIRSVSGEIACRLRRSFERRSDDGAVPCAVDDEQPWIEHWPMFEEACSKFPVLADVAAARVKLARKFNRQLPKAVEVDLAWKAHAARRGDRR